MATQDIDLGVLARGPKGDKGDKGDTGPVGPQGPANVKLAESDTRSANNAPSWYLSNYGESIITEFKQTATIGVSSILTGTYCNLTTIVSWHDVSGGLPVQIATSNDNSGRFAYRVATSTSAWGAWQQMGAQGPKGDTGDRGPQGIQGPKGEQGNVGPAPTLKIGTVTKLGPDQAPTANLSGGNGSYTLNMGIPQGETNATATNALNKVTAIQANGGGRNLLRNSNVELHGKAYDFAYPTLTVDHLEAGETYTMSWYGKVDANATKHKQPLRVYVFNGNWSFTANGFIPCTANEYQRNAFTFTVPKGVTNVNVVAFYLGHYNDDSSQNQHDKDDDAGIGYAKNYMLEKGTIAHDWQPAPEDIQSEIDANKTAAANAQNTANTAIKASETLKDLGNYTATASGTTANSPTTGLPRTSGVSMSEVYDNGYPTSYGNVLNVAGAGAGQLLLGWSGNDNTTEHLWYRSHRDTSTGGWGTWQKIAYVSDLTWSNISGKPDVATKPDVSSALTVANTAKSTADSALSKANSNATALDSKANKSDLTWANISGKPSIPDADATTTASSRDLNNYTTTGKYYMPSALANYTNHPTTGTDMGDWFVMKVDSYIGGTMIIQTIYQMNSGDVWIRQRLNSNWKSWRQINFWS